MSLTEILLIAICFMVSQIFGIALNLFGRVLIEQTPKGCDITAAQFLLRIGGVISFPTLGALGLLAIVFCKNAKKES